MIECVTAFLIFKWFMWLNGFDQDQWLYAYANFPSDDHATEIVLTGQSIFFVVLVVLQIGNLFTTRTRFVPMLPVPAFLRNWAGKSNCFNNTCNYPVEFHRGSCTCCSSSCLHRKGRGTRTRRSVKFELPVTHVEVHSPIDEQKDETVDPIDELMSDDFGGNGCLQLFQRGSRNIYIFLACAASLLTAVFFTEIKVCQDTFQTRHVEAKYWFVSVCFAIILFFLGEMRKWIMELWPRGIIAKLAW